MSKKNKKTEVAVVRPTAATSHPEVDSWVDVLVPVGTLAKSIADTDFVSDAFRGRTGSVAAAILYGREVNLPPMAALTSIHVVKGKPSLSAEAMRGLVLAAGHEIQFVEANSTRVVLAGRRNGTDRWTEMQFTIDDAKRAGLTGGNWNKYPQEMLTASATTRLCRALFPDTIAGLATVEELDDTDTTTPSAPAPKATTTRKRRRATKPKAPVTSTAAIEPAPAQSDLPPLPGEDVDATTVSDPATAAQVQKIAIVTKELGQDEKTARLALLSAIIGRPITSSKDLTRAEAHTVIDELALIQEAKDPKAALDFVLQIKPEAGA